MSLIPGHRLGPYEVVAPIGAGGMGEVYRARDTKLDRDVAIKILPDSFAHDAERVARFEREAKVLATLNHSNIAQIYGLEERALVMELVEGPTLAERIAQGALPLDEALNLAKQIAEALEAAHEKGITHRDLKPANVKITPAGVVKVLDFGLATAAQPSTADGNPSISPTLTLDYAATRAGMIMGTAAYMSPEQASGKPVDKRSDIWSFGVVLWEMLMGRRLFEGETISHVMAAVLTKEPDFNQVPPKVRLLLQRCLERDPKRRLRDIGDAWQLLGDNNVREAAPPTRRLARLGLVAGLVFLAAIVAFGWFRPRSIQPAAPDFKLSILPPKGTSFISVGSRGAVPLISPDGTILLFVVSHRQVWMRHLNALDAEPIRTLPGVSWIFWSPDSKSLGLLRDLEGALDKMQIQDGSHETIAPVVGAMRGGTWSSKGTILVATTTDSFAYVPDSGGKFQPVDGGIPGRKLGPHFLPNGEDFVFTLDDGGEDSIYLATLHRGKIAYPPVILRKAALGAQFSSAANGVVLFVADDNLYQQKLDLKARKLTGEPKLIAHGVASGTQGEADFSVSNTGVLVWRPGRAIASRLTWFDRQGHQLGGIGPAANFFRVYLAPDERRIYADSVGLQQSWIMDSATSEQVRLPWPDAVWSKNGTTLVEQASNGALVEHPLTSPNDGKIIGHWPHSGNAMVLVDAEPDGTLLFRDFAAHYLLGPGQKETEARRLPTQPGEQINGGRFSPDGRWLVYITNSGLYVQPIAFNGLRQQIAPAGSQAVWRADGKEILFYNDGRVWSIAVEMKGIQLIAGKPAPLFDYSVPTGSVSGGAILAVTRDGSRILAPIDIPQPDSDTIHVTTIR